MAKDNTVSKAVRLLYETEDALRRLKVSRTSRGSARELSVKVRIARELLEAEQPQANTDWRVVVLIRETAKLVVELLIDNIQYIFRPHVRGMRFYIRGTGTGTKVLSDSSWRTTEGACSAGRGIPRILVAGRV